MKKYSIIIVVLVTVVIVVSVFIFTGEYSKPQDTNDVAITTSTPSTEDGAQILTSKNLTIRLPKGSITIYDNNGPHTQNYHLPDQEIGYDWNGMTQDSDWQIFVNDNFTYDPKDVNTKCRDAKFSNVVLDGRSVQWCQAGMDPDQPGDNQFILEPSSKTEIVLVGKTPAAIQAAFEVVRTGLQWTN